MAGREGAAAKPSDRRAKPRFQRRLPVRFGTEAKMAGGTIVNLSESGLRIESPESFPLHAIIQVFVQFRHHAVRLKARVAWSGSGGSGAAAMGLTFTQPEPALAKAYKEWLAEVKQLSKDTQEGRDPAGTPTGPVAAAAGGSPPVPAKPAEPQAPEPRSPVRRRLESPQGRSYDVVLVKHAGGWTLTIVQMPRQLGTGANDLEGSFPSYAAAEKALRDFVRAH